MKFNELDVVKTRKKFIEQNINIGEIGTIVMSYSTPNEAYEVEFVNEDGTTKAMFAILPEDIELLNSKYLEEI